MVAASVPPVARSHRARKRAGRRARETHAVERNGTWHVHAVIRLDGRSHRVRKSLGLAVGDASQEQADEAARDYVAEIRARSTGKNPRGFTISGAALAYLSSPRERPLRPSSIRIIKQIITQFGARRLNEIPAAEWRAWIDGDPERTTPGIMTGRKSSTRERYLNSVCALLKFCTLEHGLTAAPTFRRDRKATNPNRRARRRVEDLRPDLIKLLFDQAHIATRAQIAVECDTGARVSSILHGARICDLNLADGRASITFRGTKSGRDVHAALGPSATATLHAYLAWRGGLHNREAPLFLTPGRKPYADNGGKYGTQNRSAFEGTKRRAHSAIIARGKAEATAALARGDQATAEAASERAIADAELIGKVTQHWFRHRLATLWIRRDPRAAMEQGGWLDIRSMMGYTHDDPEFRRQVAAELDPFAPAPPAADRR